MKLPNSNLPQAAVPWGRAVEDTLSEFETDQTSTEAELAAALRIVGAQSLQLQTMQNYIRKICELSGLAYPPAGSPPPPPAPDPSVPDAPAAPVSRTTEIGAQWSATWYQSFKRTSAGGTNDDRLSLYQRGSGYTYSLWRFGAGEAAGKNITGAQMFLSNISTYYNGAFTAVLGTHGYATEPGSRPPGGRTNGFDVGWSAGQGKWIDIPSWAYGGISNGSIQGFTMGDLTKETQNFARFNGVGRPGAPVLRLTFDV